MQVVNHAIFIFICHYTLKLTFSMEEEPNPIHQQSDPLDFIAVRDTVEEDIVDLQPMLPTAKDNLEENIINAVARNNLWKENKIPPNEPQDYYAPFQNKAKFFGNKMSRNNENFRQRNVGLSSDIMPRHLTQNENFLSYSRKNNRFAKGVDLNDFPLSLIKKLNGLKRSSTYKRSEVVTQNLAFDRFLNQKKVLENNRHRKAKNFRRANDFYRKQDVSHWGNNQFNSPRQRFSEDIMYRRKVSDYPRAPFQMNFKDQKFQYHRPKLNQNQKLFQTTPSSEPLKRIVINENQNTSNALSSSNIKFPDKRVLNEFANFIEKLDNNNVSSTMLSTGADEIENNTNKMEQNSGTVTSQIKEKKTAETQMDGIRLKYEAASNNQQLETFSENMANIYSSTIMTNSPFTRNEVNETNLSELLQKTKRTSLLIPSQVSGKNLNPSTTMPLYSSAQINGTTDDVIQIQLFGDFAAYSVIGREKKAVKERKRKALLDYWKRADLILTGLAGFTGLVLITACITYGQFKRKRQKKYEEIEKANDTKNDEGYSKKGSKKAGGIFKNIFRSVKKDRKKRYEEEKLKRTNKKERHDSHVHYSSITDVGSLNKTRNENVRTERKLLSNYDPMSHILKDMPQEKYTLFELEHPQFESENFVEESNIENISGKMNQRSVSDGNICRAVARMKQERNVAFTFDKNGDSHGMKAEAFSKPILRHFSSESSIQNVSQENSEPENNEIAMNSSSDSASKLNNLPSLPSVSS